MKNILLQFASTAPSDGGDMFSSLGIDWKLLILQSVAFLILLFILKKFVYPPLVAMLDKHDETVRASQKAAEEAKKHAEEAEEKTADLLKDARKEAADMLASARDEATELVEDAHKKASAKADAMMNSARDEITKEISKAKQDLQSETLDLVALATAKVLDEKVDSKKDGSLISKSIEELK